MPIPTDPTALKDLDLRLVPAHDVEPDAVLQFESRNRDYFRRWIPDRGTAYFDLTAVASSLDDARRWWHEGSDRLHVVVDAHDEIVARANLVDSADGSAGLGYRVAEAHGGRGIATAAVSDLLSLARRWEIWHVHATTSAVNVGSTRVLERCGFIPVRTRSAALQLEDTLLDALDWEVRISK